MKKSTLLLTLLTIAIIPINPLRAQEQIVLLFAGDAMQHKSQLVNAQRKGRYDYGSYFKHIKDEILAADIAIVNLEVTLGGAPYTGYPQFSAPDEYAQAIKDAGFNIFLNANNHILDRSSNGVNRTLNILDSMRIAHTGVFRNIEERNATYPLIYVWRGVRFAILNYTYGTNGINPRPPIHVNYIDRAQIHRDIQSARSLGAHLIIANMHWGDEHRMVQNREQTDLAHFMAREGVDLIIGSHPHVVQPAEIIMGFNGKIAHVIVYSLGNFISGMIAPNTDGGQIVKVIIEKHPFRPAEIKSAEYALVFRDKVRKGEKVDFTLIPVTQAERNDTGLSTIKLDPASYRKMTDFAASARRIFKKHNIGMTEYKPLTPRPPKEDYIPFLSGDIFNLLTD